MKKRADDLEEEMFLAIEIWRESGLSQAAYCRQENISPHRFKHWWKKYRSLHALPSTTSKSTASQAQTPLGFIAVGVDHSTEASVIPRLEFHYPNGVKVVSDGVLSADQVRTLIQVV